MVDGRAAVRGARRGGRAVVGALPRAATLPQLSVERLLAQRPDLVVAWGAGVRPGFIEQLAAFGVPVFVSQPARSTKSGARSRASRRWRRQSAAPTGSTAAAPRVDIESVLAARPGLVVATDSPESRARWQQIGLLAPDGAARFVYLDATALQRPGPRVLDGVEQLCEAIDEARDHSPSMSH